MGERQKPLLKHRVRLAKLYGCTVDELLDGDGQDGA